MDSFEQMLRTIVREELANMKNELKAEIIETHQTNGYPPVITVKEAREILKVGQTTMYEITKHPTFPAIRTSDSPKAHIKIPTQQFLNWIQEHAHEFNLSA
ncbi:helix-turn-helix domain-containing protein [Tepidibacillus marianensis]|uniref:helix-turn-helix domain-containing protein n=1 Tax=Tepidibacillus marianensis TaxID=3131995 RepID=UPI0030D61D66